MTRGYADRVLVELVANGVDAARAADVPAVVRISVHGAEIRIANTGTPLTAAGVAALASLRASAKRNDDGAVGHFGVGFTAVRSVTSSPRVLSTTGGVQFSADRTAQTMRELHLAALDAELSARNGIPPALRLCWPTGVEEPALPAGFVTEVRLPTADPVPATALLEEWAEASADHLFWALPHLIGVELPDRTLSRRDLPRGRVEITDAPRTGEAVVTTFDTATRSGVLPESLLADRPVEERHRSGWQVGWSLAEVAVAEDPFAAAWASADPRGAAPAAALCAPTPTDELLSLPVRLVGSFPVDETRRRLVDGPVTELLLDAAAECYLDLVAAVPAAQRWPLVPPGGFPAGEIDARLRAAVLRGWSGRPLLTSVLGDPLAVQDALSVRGVDPATLALLAEALPGLVEVPATAAAAARILGIREVPVAAVIDALSGITRPPAYWARVYAGLADADTEELAGLPVLLRDGRQVIGARGVLIPDGSVEPLAARITAVLPDLRWVHPEAVHSVLGRLGALSADPTAVLHTAALETEIRHTAEDLGSGDLDPDDLQLSPTLLDGGDEQATAGDLAALVLDLVAAGGSGVPALLASVVLTDDTGEPWPAGELMTAASPLRPLIDPDDLPTIGESWTAGWSGDVLRQVGVRTAPLVIALDDPRAGDLLPELDDWLDTEPDAAVENAVGVVDLDLVDDWVAFLPILAGERETRDAILARGSWTAWWLRRHARIQGRPLSAFRGAAVDVLAGLLDPLPFTLPEAVAGAVGVAGSVDEVIDHHPQLVLDRFCDPGRTVAPAAVPLIAARLVDRLGGTPGEGGSGGVAGSEGLELPEGIRTLAGTVVPADRVLVADGPWWGQLLPADRLLAATGRDADLVADVFGLDRAIGTVTSTRVPAATAADDHRRALALAVVADPGESDGTGKIAGPIPALTVSGPDGERRVGWWSSGDGVVHDGSDAGLAAAVAWAAGRWPDRYRVLAALTGQDDSALVAAVWDQPG